MHTIISAIERLDAAIPDLRHQFAKLTRAHGYFHQGMKTISVSDPFEDGSIDATFHGVLVKFRLLYTFTTNGDPVGRVLVLHCYAAFGVPVQAELCEFTLNQQGQTNLTPDAEGKQLNLDSDAHAVVLTCLHKALTANASLTG